MSAGENADSVGVIHGRFQVLHNDHMRYLEAGRARCHHLVVGITNPDPGLSGFDETNPARSEPSANPLTFYERHRMLSAVFLDAGWAPDRFSVVPFPVNRPELYHYYVPTDATFYLTIYDDWGRRKLEMFREAGLRAVVLWQKEPSEKGITGSQVRSAMVRGGQWQRLVPGPVVEIMEEFGAVERIRKISPGG